VGGVPTQIDTQVVVIELRKRSQNATVIGGRRRQMSHLLRSFSKS
jgi:hypothetical protein